MIDLKNSTIIGKGSSRICYQHPKDDTKCIKISILDDSKESLMEKRYYTYLEKLNISWDHLAKFYGEVKTDLGNGFIFDLVRDYDGSISQTLSFYLQTQERTKSILNPVILLDELKSYILKENIMIKDFNTKNMMYQKLNDTTARLVIVDGLHQSRILSLSAHIKYFSLKKIDKRYNEFEHSLYKKYKSNKYFIELLNSSDRSNS